MRGYKALNCDMSSKAGCMTYEIGKEYALGGQLEMCNNGYHFCKEIMGVFMHYRAGKCRVFEVDTLDGKVIEGDNKCCSDRIKLVREVTTEEIKQYIEKNLYDLVNDCRWEYRVAVAVYGYGLGKLVDDPDFDVRLAVVEQGYGLDKLVHDTYWSVRREVAKQGYGLDILVNDPDKDVRYAVAEQGYGLDKLINDDDWAVRAIVASKGYGLDKLINDENWYVRCTVAKQGYGLDKLINDDTWPVRQEASKQAKHSSCINPS